MIKHANSRLNHVRNVLLNNVRKMLKHASNIVILSTIKHGNKMVNILAIC